MTFNLQTSRQAFDDVIERVRALLSDNDPSSDDFFELMEHVRQFIFVAQDDLKKLEEAMRSPLTPRKEHDAARELHSAVRSDLDRMEASQEMLETRAEELTELETKTADKALYKAIQQRRNDLAAQIERDYPKMAASFSKLCKDIVTSNREIDNINENLPEDCAPLDRAEGYARGFPDRGSYETQASLESFRLIQSILPGVEPGSVAWPPGTNYQLHVLNHRRGFSAQEAMERYRTVQKTRSGSDGS